MNNIEIQQKKYITMKILPSSIIAFALVIIAYNYFATKNIFISTLIISFISYIYGYNVGKITEEITRII